MKVESDLLPTVKPVTSYRSVSNISYKISLYKSVIKTDKN